jgi:beta-xylosidase/AraC-like DNA-binding protein
MPNSIMDFGFVTGNQQHTHLHQNLEILYLLEGRLDVQIDEEKYMMKEGDYLLVNANKRHSAQAQKPEALVARFQIDYSMLTEYLGTSHILFWCNTVVDKNEVYEELRQIMDCILNRYFEKNEENALYLNSLYYKALYLLTSNFMVKSNEVRINIGGLQDASRVLEIQNYVQSNYQKQIGLNDLAKQLYLSNAYLSRYIKKHLGLSFLEYVNNVRLFHAVDELLYTGKKIIRIAVDNGFPTTASFNKTFKNSYQMTPSAYRLKIGQEQKNQKEAVESKEEIKEKVRKYLDNKSIAETIIKAKSTEVVSVDANITAELKRPWGKVINIGDALSLLHSDVQQHVLLITKELGFEYIRLWSIFMPSMYDENGEIGKRFNFSKLDRIFDFLVENRLKPYIELGFKPMQLIKTAEEYLVRNENEIFFHSHTQYEAAMQELASHLVNRYGMEEIESWYFELWKDPRMNIEDADGWYYENFEAGYQALKKISRKIKVGGAGFLLGYENFLYKKIIHLWKRRGIEPDFLTVYAYWYVTMRQNGMVFGKKSLDSNFITNQLDIFKKTLKEEKFDINEIHISEWNFTISNRNHFNDSCAQGAYIIENCIAAEGKIDLMAYWHGTDLYSEYYDTGAIINGDSGLLTKDGIRKPAFYAFQFLSSLHHKLLGKNEHSIVTTNGSGSYTIVCHNSKKLTYKYAMKEENEIDIEQQDSLYEELEPLNLSVRINHLENGNYVVKIYYINRNNGSVQDAWKQMDYTKNLSGGEIDYLQRTSIPRMEMKKLKVEEGIVRVEATLQPHEIRMINLSYQY